MVRLIINFNNVLFLVFCFVFCFGIVLAARAFLLAALHERGLRRRLSKFDESVEKHEKEFCEGIKQLDERLKEFDERAKQREAAFLRKLLIPEQCQKKIEENPC